MAPYIGVRSILQASGLLRHSERIVQELGIETIHDLLELTEADFARLGFADVYPRFRRALMRVMDEKRKDKGMPGRGAKYRIGRHASLQAIVAAGTSAFVRNASAVPLFLQAAGASMYARRLEWLGVAVPEDLRWLRAADLSELGMAVLHARRFLQVVRHTPRHDEPEPPARHNPGASRSLCVGLLIPMHLGHLCDPLALALGGATTAAAVLNGIHDGIRLDEGLCRLTPRHLERAGAPLLTRRRLAHTINAMAPSLCTNTAVQSGGSGSDSTQGAALLPTLLSAFLGARSATSSGGSSIASAVPPPPTATAAGGTANFLDGCHHVFIDVGANVGMNAQHLFRWRAVQEVRGQLKAAPAPHHQYRHGAMQPLFDRYFGLGRYMHAASAMCPGLSWCPLALSLSLLTAYSSARCTRVRCTCRHARRGSVCVVGIEANPNHSPALRAVARAHNAHGMKIFYLTETAVAAHDGSLEFHLQNLTKSGRAVHEWGASAYNSKLIEGQGVAVKVRAMDLARFVIDVVLARRLPPTASTFAAVEIAAAASRRNGTTRDQAEYQAEHPPPSGGGSSSSSHSLATSGTTDAWTDGSMPIALGGRVAGEGLALPSTVMKMDIEGSEFAVLSRMLALGALCRLDAIAIEWHDERTKGTRPIFKATGAPSNFSSLLSYVVGAAAAPKDCPVRLVDLSVDGT